MEAVFCCRMKISWDAKVWFMERPFFGIWGVLTGGGFFWLPWMCNSVCKGPSHMVTWWHKEHTLASESLLVTIFSVFSARCKVDPMKVLQCIQGVRVLIFQSLQPLRLFAMTSRSFSVAAPACLTVWLDLCFHTEDDHSAAVKPMRPEASGFVYVSPILRWIRGVPTEMLGNNRKGMGCTRQPPL